MSFAPEVQTDSTGKWYGNALRFATHKEAMDNAADLSWRWFAVRDYRAASSSDPVNYSYTSGKLEAVKLEDLPMLTRDNVRDTASTLAHHWVGPDTAKDRLGVTRIILS